MNITRKSIFLQYAVNLEAVVNVSQVVAKGMIESGNGGSIVNVSSTMSHKILPGAACYGATKAGVTTMSKFMAAELADFNIRVNCIQPGAVDTPMIHDKQGNLPDMVQRVVNWKTVQKGMITPDEIADLVLFLLSPLSKRITGQAINIDAGLLE